MNVELLPQIFDKESLSNFVIDELKKNPKAFVYCDFLWHNPHTQCEELGVVTRIYFVENKIEPKSTWFCFEYYTNEGLATSYECNLKDMSHKQLLLMVFNYLTK